jgi:acyl carrier protein
MTKDQNEMANYLKSYLNNEKINSLNDKDFLRCRYLDLGYLDSFDIIHLIVDIERKFNITIESSDTESDKFRYFKGLIEIIQSKL